MWGANGEVMLFPKYLENCSVSKIKIVLFYFERFYFENVTHKITTQEI